MSDLDDLLRQLAELRRQLAEVPEGDPERTILEERRTIIHRKARLASDRMRPAGELRQELSAAQQRLARLEQIPINPSFTERRQQRWPIGNPTGYAQKINAAIEEQTRSERDELAERIAELTGLLGER